MRVGVPLCYLCEHYEGGLNDEGVTRCTAFPEGIPTEILDGLADHRIPLGGETVVFKPRSGVTPEMVEKWAEAAEQSRPFTGTTYGSDVEGESL